MSDDEPDGDDVEEDQPTGTDPLVDDAADPKQIKRKVKRAVLEKQETADFWRAVLSSSIGRREVWAILQAGHCFEERFACGPNGFPQSEATFFHAGEQALAQRIYDSLQIIDHSGVYLMRCEHDPRFAKAPKPRIEG